MNRRIVWAAAVLWSLPAGAPQAHAQTPGSEPTRFRIAVSSSTTEGVNDNDARAAIRIWTDTFVSRTGMEGNFGSGILTSPEQLFEAVRKGAVDTIAITAPEFPQVAAYVDPEMLVGDETDLRRGDEYILLVHRQSEIRQVSELRGRSLILQKGVRTCLARVWLETLAFGAGLKNADLLCGRITESARPAMVTLPVFFRQADAGIVTRRAFEAMCEMNPQLADRLRIVAVSPKVLHTCLLFHKDCDPQLKKRLRDALLSLHESPGGQQILSFWQGRRLRVTEVSVMRGGLDLMAAYERGRGAKRAFGKPMP